MQREYRIPPQTDFARLSVALADIAGDMVLFLLYRYEASSHYCTT